MNLRDKECTKEVKISVHVTEAQKKDLILLLREYMDVFAWVYNDMIWLSTNMVSHKLPINPGFNLVKPKTQNFKPELSLLRIEETYKRIESQLVIMT